MNESDRVGKALVFVVIVLSSAVLTLAALAWTVFAETDHVANARDARATHYGAPLTWITQDQRLYLQKPTWPTNATLGNPRHNPSNIDLGNFLLDILIVGLVPTATYIAGRGATRLCKPRTRHRRATQALP